MSLYNVQVSRTPEGYDVTLRCLYGHIRAVVELAADRRARPDAEDLAVALLADRHDAVCAHRCVDSLKRPDHPAPVTIPEAHLQLGAATAAITDVPVVGPGGFHVEIICPHRTVEGYGLAPPGTDRLDAYMEVLRECGRRHRRETRCECVPDPDEE